MCSAWIKSYASEYSLRSTRQPASRTAQRFWKPIETLLTLTIDTLRHDDRQHPALAGISAAVVYGVDEMGGCDCKCPAIPLAGRSTGCMAGKPIDMLLSMALICRTPIHAHSAGRFRSVGAIHLSIAPSQPSRDCGTRFQLAPLARIAFCETRIVPTHEELGANCCNRIFSGCVPGLADGCN